MANKSPLPSFATSFLQELFDYMATLEYRPREIPTIYDKHSSLLELSNEILLTADGSSANGATLLHAPAKSRLRASAEALIEPPNDSKHASHYISLALHDPLTLAIVVDPSIVQKTNVAHISVETESAALTRGQLLVSLMICA
jgi:hypothetical protein